MDLENIKTIESSFGDDDSPTNNITPEFETIIDEKNQHFGSSSTTLTERPRNLEDLISKENLSSDTTEANFSLGDISDSDEIWVIDIPKTIDPKNFKGRTIKLGKKNDFQIENGSYETSSITNHNHEQQLSLVLNTGRWERPYKTVNVKPAGCLRIRQKLARVVNANLVTPKKAGVPFPKNLKLRHPLFGHDYKERYIKISK